MSDEEGGWMDDAEDTQENREESRGRTIRKEEPEVVKTEAQLMIEAKQRKAEEEDADRIRDIEEKVRLQREKEDEELRKLKEKQAARKKERELEEQKLEEQKRQIEELRRQEEEARKVQKEEEKRKKQEAEERKKQAQQAALVGGRNFVIEKAHSGESTIDKFMNISKAKTEMSLNTGELATLKERTISDRVKPLSLGDMDHGALKARAEELWKSIVNLETLKYDLVERSKRQDYDLKQLNERQRQVQAKRYAAQGLDTGEASSPYKPKVQLVSKYERRIDRRTFAEKKSLYENERKEGAEGGAGGEPHKPSAKKRDAWVKSKKPAGGEDEEEEQPEEAVAQEEEEESPW